jgi:hypothetical protein
LPGRAQENETPLSVKQILQKADSVSHYQDSLLAGTKYRVREEAIFNELNNDGSLKNSDTVITAITMQGKRELSREIIYTTKESKGEKKENSGQAEFSLIFDDPDYNFSLTDTNETSYIIAVSPKAEPKKGEVRETLVIDKRSYFTARIDLEVPRPEGALKEFATQMSFEPLEGGLVVLKEMRMRGFAKAFLGIFKMRFSGEIRYSNYEILE